MSRSAYIAIDPSINIITYILSFITAYYCSRILVWYLSTNIVKKKIKVEVNYAGNKEIPEFYDNDGNKKCIKFEISEDSTIGEVKDEIAKRVESVYTTIALSTNPRGKKLWNKTNIICFHNTDPLYLYITFPNYSWVSSCQ